MKWLNKYMQGRAGGDHLSIFLLVFSVVITIFGRLTGFFIIESLSYIPLGLGIYRMFSKNIQQRRMENYKFMMKISPLYKKGHRLFTRLRNSKNHKLMPCTSCKSMLRVPKNKGKIRVTCPSCKTRFIKKT
ncbi:hypothetical protein [Isachenkonia alkalipeptolytica]|uniref:FORGETTER1 second zinc ribbon domain-containing protein n=1 Tax=Isachenkonia alkalipeptolytica TaxID=2565777 RepID=A0AA43XMC2_9CLOT|nr:hypothetical protein [Isachenkonia alkalipeptolytica]NBG88580.1 hypothetical protein [Isachenkonia alkalipeptolytica]